MLLDLRRRERHPRASHVSNRTLALRMQDEDCGRDVAAFSKYRHWAPQCFNRRLEDQDGLLGHQPTCVIHKQPSFDTVLRSSYPHPTEEGSDQSTRKDRNQGREASAQNRHRPVEDQGRNAGEAPENNGGQGRPESTAPKEGVPYVYLSVRGLVHPCGAAEAPSLQLP
jgi:hypothetical protein